MKTTILIIAFCCIAWMTQAQTIQLGYYGHFGIDPGVKAGVQIKLMGEDAGHQLYTSPQLGYFNQRVGYQSFVINNDIGYLHRKEVGGFYKAVSLGTGYILEHYQKSVSTSLGDGTSTSNSQLNHMFMATINGELGGRIINDLGWYAKISCGGKVPRNDAFELVLLAELGLTYSLN